MAAAERARRVAPGPRPKRLEARAPQGERVTLPRLEGPRLVCGNCGCRMPGPGGPPRPCCPEGGTTREERERLQAAGLLPVLGPWRWPDELVDRTADRAMAARLAKAPVPTPAAPAAASVREAPRLAAPAELALTPLEATPAKRGGRRGRR